MIITPNQYSKCAGVRRTFLKIKSKYIFSDEVRSGSEVGLSSCDSVKSTKDQFRAYIYDFN